jgi:phenylacetate-CoA ligase
MLCDKTIATFQLPMLNRLLSHAAQHTQYYASATWARNALRGDKVDLAKIRITPKGDLRGHSDAFVSSYVPPEHGIVIEKFTSGSTGIALRVPKTALHFKINSDENRRLNRFSGENQSMLTVAVTPPDEVGQIGVVSERLQASGLKTYNINSFNSDAVVELVAKVRPQLFKSRPNLMEVVLRKLPSLDFLKQIKTVSEIVPAGLKELVKDNPNLTHTDSYGTVETGILGQTCKQCGKFHIAHRHAIVEIVDERGNPTVPGQMGRVIVTGLSNLAMPLIRYDIGDFAVLSKDGACDGSVALDRVVGRTRDLFKLADGSRVIPYLKPDELLSLGVRQAKLIQRQSDEIDFEYVPRELDFELGIGTAQRLVDAAVSPGFRVVLRKVRDMPLKTGAKHRMHECMI